jgi:NAD(P)-dependent dehydrogenase (short-subunit alcohol dehydrogenase family)
MKKTALVTGGNRGVGEQVCREVARAGWDVLLATRDPKKGDQPPRTSVRRSEPR